MTKKKPKLRMEKSAAGTKPAQRKDTRSPAIKKRK